MYFAKLTLEHLRFSLTVMLCSVGSISLDIPGLGDMHSRLKKGRLRASINS